MKFSTILFNVLSGAFLLFGANIAQANVCLMTENGGAEDCDNGDTANRNLNYSANTISKQGTSGLCNNVTAFADKNEAIWYAKTHEFDGGIETKNYCSTAKCQINYKTRAEFTDSNPVARDRKYKNQFKNGEDSDYCLSRINGKCLLECDVCKFNSINGEFYPYADTELEECELVGHQSMSFIPAIYKEIDSNNMPYYPKNYRITEFRDILPKDSWDTDVYKCDYSTVGDILSKCATQASNTKMVRGLDMNTVVTRTATKYLCLNGSKVYLNTGSYDAASLNNNTELPAFVQKYGCPRSAIKCNDENGYYSDQDTCGTKAGTKYACTSIKNYNDYGDFECWKKAPTCYYLTSGTTYVYNTNGIQCDANEHTVAEPFCGYNFTGTCQGGVEGVNIKLKGEFCSYCACQTGYNRTDKCGNTINDIIRRYYSTGSTDDTKNYCKIEGYTLGINETSTNYTHCEACPYNANFWRCN